MIVSNLHLDANKRMEEIGQTDTIWEINKKVSYDADD